MRKHGRPPGADTTPPHPLPSAPAAAPAAAARGRRAHAGLPAVEHTGHQPRAEAPLSPAVVRGRGRRLGRRTVRAKIICVLMVLVVSLLALWGFATVAAAAAAYVSLGMPGAYTPHGCSIQSAGRTLPCRPSYERLTELRGHGDVRAGRTNHAVGQGS